MFRHTLLSTTVVQLKKSTPRMMSFKESAALLSQITKLTKPPPFKLGERIALPQKQETDSVSTTERRRCLHSLCGAHKIWPSRKVRVHQPWNDLFKSVRAVFELLFAWAKTEVPACNMMLLRVSSAVSSATSTSRIREFAADRFSTETAILPMVDCSRF